MRDPELAKELRRVHRSLKRSGRPVMAAAVMKAAEALEVEIGKLAVGDIELDVRDVRLAQGGVMVRGFWVSDRVVTVDATPEIGVIGEDGRLVVLGRDPRPAVVMNLTYGDSLTYEAGLFAYLPRSTDIGAPGHKRTHTIPEGT